jgi:hypothetical protein
LRADFIPRLGDLVRTEADATPLEVVGAVNIGENRGLSVTCSAAGDPSFSVTETGVLEGVPGDEPIFRSGRLVRATHREPDPISMPLPDDSSALWTGVYTWTQALRYRTTGEGDALDNLRRSLRGLLILMDITGDPRTFARTLRPAGPPLTGPWRRGTGEFSNLDWMVGGNNDMSKGHFPEVYHGVNSASAGASTPPNSRIF